MAMIKSIFDRLASKKQVTDYNEWLQAGNTKKRSVIEAWAHEGANGNDIAIANLIKASYGGKSADASRFLKDMFYHILTDAIVKQDPQKARIVFAYMDQGIDEALDAYTLHRPPKPIENQNETELAITKFFASAGDEISLYLLGVNPHENDGQSSVEPIAKAINDGMSRRGLVVDAVYFDPSEQAASFNILSQSALGTTKTLCSSVDGYVEFDAEIFRYEANDVMFNAAVSLRDTMEEYANTAVFLSQMLNSDSALLCVLHVDYDLPSYVSIHVKKRCVYSNTSVLPAFAIQQFDQFITEMEHLARNYFEKSNEYEDAGDQQ